MARIVVAELSALLRPDRLVAARTSWRATGVVRLFDATVPSSVPAAGDLAVDWLRELVEEFAWGADLLRISVADIARLYGPAPPLRAARRLRASGPGAVLLVCAAHIGVLVCADPSGRVRADGPSDLLIGLWVTPSTQDLRAALTRRVVPSEPNGWVRLAHDLPGT